MEIETLEDTTHQFFTVGRYIDRNDGSDPWLWVDHSTTGRFITEQEALSHAKQLTETMFQPKTSSPYFPVRITDIRMVERVDGKST
jgi:hypothetical protein